MNKIVSIIIYTAILGLVLNGALETVWQVAYQNEKNYRYDQCLSRFGMSPQCTSCDLPDWNNGGRYIEMQVFSQKTRRLEPLMGHSVPYPEPLPGVRTPATPIVKIDWAIDGSWPGAAISAGISLYYVTQEM